MEKTAPPMVSPPLPSSVVTTSSFLLIINTDVPPSVIMLPHHLRHRQKWIFRYFRQFRLLLYNTLLNIAFFQWLSPHNLRVIRHNLPLGNNYKFQL